MVSNPPPRPWTTIETDVVEWAYGRFRAAGLDLPTVEIAFSADADDCAGEQGVYRRRAGAHSVTVCVPDLEGAAIDHRRLRTLLHELAHVWDHSTLTDADRELLLPALEASDWYDQEGTWDQRGVERLAETLTWGLLDQKRRPLKIDTHCAAVHDDFITITGSKALGPIDGTCEIDTAPRPSRPKTSSSPNPERVGARTTRYHRRLRRTTPPQFGTSALDQALENARFA